jgi:hypothetical protein
MYGQGSATGELASELADGRNHRTARHPEIVYGQVDKLQPSVPGNFRFSGQAKLALLRIGKCADQRIEALAAECRQMGRQMDPTVRRGHRS